MFARTRWIGALWGMGVFTVAAQADWIISDGSDGVFHPTTSQTIQMETVAPDGVFNFTTIHIPAGVTISFARNAANTPVIFAATGDVLIEGTVNISGSNFSRTAGPGGGDGGATVQSGAGFDGEGLGGGEGGPPSSRFGNGGGGGGCGTPGLVATSRTGPDPGAGGGATGKVSMVPGMPGGGGSGGGGGSTGLFFGIDLGAGVGGGAGGGMQISTPGTITLAGSLLSRGGHGAWAFANIGGRGGPGGGGSGGIFFLHAGAIVLEETAVMDTRGGAGGGLSTETVPYDPYYYSSGANGGEGLVVFDADILTSDPNAVLIGVPSIMSCGLADANGDGNVDASDYDGLMGCLAGPGVALEASCVGRDLDADGDVDIDDWTQLQPCVW